MPAHRSKESEMKLAVISLLAAGFIGIQPAQSETYVSGELSTTTWTAANGPYRVVDTLTVLTGHSLTIEPGVDVLFDADVPIFIRGRIHAVGTELDSIRFLAGADSVWGGLRISGGDSSTLHFVRVSDVLINGIGDALRRYEARGGGIRVVGDRTRLGMARSVVSGNVSAGGFRSCSRRVGAGGGLLVDSGAFATLEDCVIANNAARYGFIQRPVQDAALERPGCGDPNIARGGGIAVFGATVHLTRCVIERNVSSDLGGGVYVGDDGYQTYDTSYLYMVDCVVNANSQGGVSGSEDFLIDVSGSIIQDNVGGGIWTGDSGIARVINCTVVGNDIGIRSYSDLIAINTILWANASDPFFSEYVQTDVRYSIVQGDAVRPGNGNFLADPLFVDPENGDYRLQPGSPAINAGAPTIFDADGSRLDIGALPYGGGTPVAVAEGLRPGALTLSAAPNPFNPSTLLTYGVAKPGGVQMRVYNTAGQLVRTLVDEPRGAGTHSIQWNGEDTSGRVVASGVYIVRLTTSKGELFNKVTLLR
jgi:hypothetical protein